tara:strand:- start:1027 stop:1524 length:498 start_codon:yes stop_codon:yes gene_type:complete
MYVVTDNLATQEEGTIEKIPLSTNLKKDISLDSNDEDQLTQPASEKKMPVHPFAQNRRRDSRRPARWRFRGLYGSNKKSFAGNTLNVSRSGFLITTPSMFPVGEETYLLIDTYVNGKKRELRALAKVMHSSLSGDQFLAGVEIKKMPDQHRAFLQNYVSDGNPDH